MAAPIDNDLVDKDKKKEQVTVDEVLSSPEKVC